MIVAELRVTASLLRDFVLTPIRVAWSRASFEIGAMGIAELRGVAASFWDRIATPVSLTYSQGHVAYTTTVRKGD
jgi:hypothetical protein